MLKDTPYSIIKNDSRAYEIMLLKDIQGCTYVELSKKFQLSAATVTILYSRAKLKQMRLYINRISFALGHEDFDQIRQIASAAFDCYQDRKYVCAYFEKRYNDILTEFRKGEPGLPKEFLENLPPLITKLDSSIITKIVEMRESKKATFKNIAARFNITPAKAHHIYYSYYHKKITKLIDEIQQESGLPRPDLWEYYYKNINNSKKQYDIIMQNILEKRDIDN